MDILWIILDSLSFEATPFKQDGPNTMPALSTLADERGIIYTHAYSPGPTSPSSHSSFFTGKRPSVTGMHEANPYFTADLKTINESLQGTQSYAVSTNPFIFNGLCDNFDEIDDLRTGDYMVFEGGSDPVTDGSRIRTGSVLRDYLTFVFEGGAPLRSAVNGVSFKLWQRTRNSTEGGALDDEDFQYANTMNDRIRTFLDSNASDSFVVANYMDVHSPLDASDEALQRFAPNVSRDELPIGVSGQEIHKRIQEGDAEVGERMYDLYKAAIWDVDRKIAPLIREAVNRGTFVAVTADHGNWFRRETELDEERIHVPLILFAPDEPARTIDKTVNIRSLPRTTMEVTTGTDGGFEGTDLTSVTEHQLSVTELIHDPETPGSPVDPRGKEDQSIRYDLAVVKGDTRVDFVEGEYRTIRDGGRVEELEQAVQDLRSKKVEFDPVNEMTNSVTEDRLKQLGYLE